MIVKEITYENYDGDTITEEFRFNLNQAEVFTMEGSRHGGYSKVLERMIAAKSVPDLLEEFEKLIRASYGIKSEDGKRFVKNKEIVEDFINSAAYPVLYMDLLTNEGELINFVNGIFPKAPEKLAVPNAVN